ncbi:MAG: hypothetical protein ACQETE_09235 [Bacteroidota bacterium]
MFNINRHSTIWIAFLFGISLTLNLIHTHEQVNRHFSHIDCEFDHTLVPDSNVCPLCAIPLHGVNSDSTLSPQPLDTIQILSESSDHTAHLNIVSAFSERAPPLV